MKKLIGKVLDGKYEIIDFLGQGGMADVYKAKDKRIERFVAVKVLKNEYGNDSQLLKKFLREAQADATFAHPNIVNVYDIGMEDGIYYIVMEYIDGCTLKSYIKARKKVDQVETLAFAQSIAGGLLHAHKNNILHRDIKPHNILLTSSKIPKIGDFGIAKAITSSTLTSTQEALGSVHYISPEQAKGGFLDERSDLYSFGIMLYEMLTGELPYNGETLVAVALKHLQNDVGEVRSKVRSVSRGMNQVVLNLTRRNPDERYQNAELLIKDLIKLSEDINAQIEPTYTVIPSEEKQHKIFKRTENNVSSEKEVDKVGFFQNKRNRYIVITAVVVALAIIIIVLNNIYSSMIKVPNVIGLPIEKATQELLKLDIKYEIIERQFSTEYIKDVVIEQSPSRDEWIRDDELVQLTLSDGNSIQPVPNVVGKFESEAKSLLTNAGFIVKEVIYENNEDVKNGVVFSQNPNANVEARQETEVIIYVSKGKDSVSVPALVGETLEQAKRIITENGLMVGKIEYAPSDDYDNNAVMKQTPSAHAEAGKGASVDLVVSLGPNKTKYIDIDLSLYTADIVDKETVGVKVVLLAHPNKIIFEENKNPRDVITVKAEGNGSMIYKLYIDSEEKYSGVIDF